MSLENRIAEIIVSRLNVKPEEVTPGVANYYASTYFESNEYCSILVKVILH